jgi:hypothetical protein
MIMSKNLNNYIFVDVVNSVIDECDFTDDLTALEHRAKLQDEHKVPLGCYKLITLSGTGIPRDAEQRDEADGGTSTDKEVDTSYGGCTCSQVSGDNIHCSIHGIKRATENIKIEIEHIKTSMNLDNIRIEELYKQIAALYSRLGGIF